MGDSIWQASPLPSFIQLASLATYGFFHDPRSHVLRLYQQLKQTTPKRACLQVSTVAAGFHRGMENSQVSSQYCPIPGTQFPLSFPPHPLLTDPKPLTTHPTSLMATAVLPLTLLETLSVLEKRFFLMRDGRNIWNV